MNEIDSESVRLTRKLSLCSNAIARSIGRLKDIESIKRENDVIVFITSNPNQIQSALQKSLKNNGLSLDYVFTTAKDFFVTDTKTQVFVTTNEPLEANSLKSQNPKFIIVEIANEISSQNINRYMELMVKNINTHMKFNIKIRSD